MSGIATMRLIMVGVLLGAWLVIMVEFEVIDRYCPCVITVKQEVTK